MTLVVICLDFYRRCFYLTGDCTADVSDCRGIYFYRVKMFLVPSQEAESIWYVIKLLINDPELHRTNENEGKKAAIMVFGSRIVSGHTLLFMEIHCLKNRLLISTT